MISNNYKMVCNGFCNNGSKDFEQLNNYVYKRGYACKYRRGTKERGALN